MGVSPDVIAKVPLGRVDHCTEYYYTKMVTNMDLPREQNILRVRSAFRF